MRKVPESLQVVTDYGRKDAVIPVLLEYMIWPILILTAIIIAILVPQTFRNTRTLTLVIYTAVPLGLLVLGESICLLSGHFDLSVGAIAGFSAMFTGILLADCLTCWNLISSPYLAIVIILVTGGVIGAANGILIAKIGLNPFLQTLAFLIIFHGAKTALSTQPVRNLPDEYLYLGGNIGPSIGILVLAFVIVTIVMSFTNFGQSVYAVGSDKESARAVGVNTDRIVIAVYLISGVLAGLAGLMLTGFTTVVSPNIARGMVFPAFAAAVIGGVSLFGGRGKIVGALGGLLLLGLVQAALDLSGVSAPMIEMANGIVLLIAIVLYNTKENIRSRYLAAEST